MTNYFIGIDDTDAGDSIGTGALARELMQLLVRDLQAQSRGITRHQLLVDPRIPYTSHNSSACLEVSCEHRPEPVAEACRRFVNYLFHPGADPGLCLAWAGQPFSEAQEFGRLAQREVVDASGAWRIAEKAGFVLEERGGTGLGVIGALCACGLRMGGCDGRFISLEGIRDVEEIMSATDILSSSGIEEIRDQHGSLVMGDIPIATRNWLRPELHQGCPVLRVIREHDGSLSVDKRKRNQDDM
ncbi:MAG: hypothetical protein MUC50_12135 [Myxococcota bacterium]|jgi:tRNA(Ile2) C34 agmatinyltransferase TiaS|nr:hypothetical protein [Myxococcota bacterium]